MLEFSRAEIRDSFRKFFIKAIESFPSDIWPEDFAEIAEEAKKILLEDYGYDSWHSFEKSITILKDKDEVFKYSRYYIVDGLKRSRYAKEIEIEDCSNEYLEVLWFKCVGRKICITD